LFFINFVYPSHKPRAKTTQFVHFIFIFLSFRYFILPRIVISILAKITTGRAVKRKWREIEAVKERQRLKKELEDIDWSIEDELFEQLI